MKTLLKLVILVCGCWVLSYYIDWKFSLIFPFILSLLFPNRWVLWEFALSFIGVFLVWMTAAIIIDGGNNGILSGRLAGIFGFPNGSSIVIWTGILGGVLGASGGVTGYYLNRIFSVSHQKK